MVEMRRGNSLGLDRTILGFALVIVAAHAVVGSSPAFVGILSALPGKTAMTKVCSRSAVFRRRSNLCSLRASGADSGEEGSVSNTGSGPSPEDWRQFRANLIAQQKEKEGNETVVRSVAKKNEELLRSQNPVLAEEYLQGAWAHVTGQPEVGGLMARNPIEAQLAHLMVKDESSEWGRRLRLRFEEEIKQVAADDDSDEEQLQLRRESWGSNTAYMYKLSKALLTDALDMLTSKGEIDVDRLKPEDRELIQLYAKYQDSWQEVLLVVEHDAAEGDASTALVINRPIRVGMDVSFASMFLHGRDTEQQDLDSQLLLKFVMAFGREAPVYLGGPHRVSQPGMMVHGFEELEGARELAPGTGIYEGGVEAAVKGVLEGMYTPLDFRFFIGCREWERGELEAAVLLGEYRTIACARPLALKQCLGLPKPLWHEVMELCGGESRELSRLEILQRSDIEQD